jgi:Resolvase, N terminal domain
VCFAHHPAECTCPADHPLALVYVRRQTAMINGRATARGDYDRCLRAAGRLDALVVGRYLDDGSSEAPQRPGLDALLDRLTVIADRHEAWGTRHVEYVIVAQADQLARRTTTWQRIDATVTGAGARVVLASECWHERPRHRPRDRRVRRHRPGQHDPRLRRPPSPR